MEGTLHPMPRGRDVVHEQIRIVAFGLRAVALVAAVVVGILTLMIAVAIVRRSAATWFDSDEWFPIGVVGFLVPFAVWRGEKRFGPAFLWTLPVDRRRLALAKVFAGWVWLMAALAVFVLWHFALALLSGVAGAKIVSLFVFIGATALYLLGSALVLGLRHPLRWLFGAVGLFFLLGALNEGMGRPTNGASMIVAWSALLRWSGGFTSAVDHAAAVWLTLPAFAQWAMAAFLWLGAGLAALWAAVSRHGERRRH